MGRAMLIICAGVLLSLGIVAMSTADMGKLLTQNTTTYASNVSAKNAAHTGIQIAMQKISDDTLWAENHGPDNIWKDTLNSADDSIHVYVEYLNDDYATNEYWKADSIRVVSEGLIYTKSPIESKHSSTVSSVYLMSKFSDLVPDFISALTGSTDKINFSASGSSSISGMAPDGTTCQDMPAMTTTNETDSAAFSDELSGIDSSGDPLVDKDTSLSYQPTDQLIQRLSNSNDVTYLTKNYKDDMGTADDPGVFFVEDTTSLTGGITEGHGILVVRSGGEIGYEGEDGATLETAGEFTFNGLVIFEDAFNLKSRGTASINGSVLVGNSESYTGDGIDVDINGNMNIQYDCRGENYAKKAAANATNQNKYTRVVSYEETGY